MPAGDRFWESAFHSQNGALHFRMVRWHAVFYQGNTQQCLRARSRIAGTFIRKKSYSALDRSLNLRTLGRVSGKRRSRVRRKNKGEYRYQSGKNGRIPGDFFQCSEKHIFLYPEPGKGFY